MVLFIIYHQPVRYIWRALLCQSAFENKPCFCPCLPNFSSSLHQNLEKSRKKEIFWPSFGVRGTQTLVEIYNREYLAIKFWHSRLDHFSILVSALGPSPAKDHLQEVFQPLNLSHLMHRDYNSGVLCCWGYFLTDSKTFHLKVK